jgi:hypothetical protein
MVNQPVRHSGLAPHLMQCTNLKATIDALSLMLVLIFYIPSIHPGAYGAPETGFLSPDDRQTTPEAARTPRRMAVSAPVSCN